MEAYQESVVLAESAVGEDQKEFSAIRGLVRRLERVWTARGEVPEVAGALDTRCWDQLRRLKLVGTRCLRVSRGSFGRRS